MIVLDTNVISEAMRPKPEAAVLDWLDEQAGETLFITTITLAELLFGISALPAGRRRNRLAEAFEGVAALFGDRVLAFDTDAARQYATLAARARKAGRGLPTADGYIAAIAAARGFAVASRDVGPFVAAGVEVIDPWRSGAAQRTPGET